MHSFYRSIALILSVTVLALFAQSEIHGQSMPAGQVSHRMSTRPMNAPVTTTPTSTNTPGATISADNSSQDDQASLNKALGAANYALWARIVDLDNTSSDASTLQAQELRSLTKSLSDSMTQTAAKNIIEREATSLNDSLDPAAPKFEDCPKPVPANTAAEVVAKRKADCETLTKIDALNQLRSTLKKYRCWYSTDSTTPATTQAQNNATPKFNYLYPRPLLPLNGRGCSVNSAQKAAPIQNFFGVSGPTEVASNAQYIYNAQLSTSQVNAQLLTATFSPGSFFPPFQAVLSGTATSGSSGGSNSTATTATTRRIRSLAAGAQSDDATTDGSTDSTTTTMAKIQAGGDFNLSLPTPWLYHASDRGSISGYFTPNLGFNINGFSGQNTITEATEYAINIPVEFYAQTYSLESGSNGLPSATLFVDLKPSAEVISATLAKSISPDTSRLFFLGQAAVGIEFAQSIRISFQYIYSQKNIFTPNTSLGSTAGATQNANGFHLAVSFAPQSAKKAALN